MRRWRERITTTHLRLPETNPLTEQYEEKAKNILKGELRRRGITYAELVERLAKIGASETERNIANKISRGGFSAAFFVQCLEAIGAHSVRVTDA